MGIFASAIRGCGVYCFRSFILAGIGLVVTAGWQPSALAEVRVALVIGNGAYQNAPRLPNPTNDAVDVAASLRRAGFDTILATDLDKAGMEDATAKFARAAANADVAMFYYSGHAIQFAGINYLAPVDTRLKDEVDLRRMTRVDQIVHDLQNAKNLRILVLDACRDNPLADELRQSRGGGSRALNVQDGLAKLEAPRGMIVSYATQAGRTAEDGSERNSPYTSAFLKHIEAQEEIGTIFRRITSDVYESTSQRQLPELSLSLIGEFYLRVRITVKLDGTSAQPDPRAEFEAAERADSVAGWDAFIARHPEGYYTTLAKERRSKAAGRVASLAPSGGLQAPADGSAASDDLLFWRFAEAHASRRMIEAYLAKFPKGYFADVANLRLQGMKADNDEPQIDYFRQSQVRVVSRPVKVLSKPDADASEVGELQKGTEAIVGGVMSGGDILLLRAPITGYALSAAFEPLENHPARAVEWKSAERKLAAAVAAFSDDAARLKAPVWGAIAKDAKSNFYGAFAKTDIESATTAAMEECRKDSKNGNCQFVWHMYRECFALARSTANPSKWAWAIRDMPDQAKADSLAECTKQSKICKNSWLICADSRQ